MLVRSDDLIDDRRQNDRVWKTDGIVLRDGRPTGWEPGFLLERSREKADVTWLERWPFPREWIEPQERIDFALNLGGIHFFS